MKLEFKKSFSDVRGIILFCSFGKSSLHFVKTKKGFSRGGHYHKFKSDHILLQGQDDYIKTKERFSIIKDFFIKNNIDFKEINSVSGNILTKTICLIYILDYTSIYKAVLSKIDPSPVSSIDYIKSRLTE